MLLNLRVGILLLSFYCFLANADNDDKSLKPQNSNRHARINANEFSLMAAAEDAENNVLRKKYTEIKKKPKELLKIPKQSPKKRIKIKDFSRNKNPFNSVSDNGNSNNGALSRYRFMQFSRNGTSFNRNPNRLSEWIQNNQTRWDNWRNRHPNMFNMTENNGSVNGNRWSQFGLFNKNMTGWMDRFKGNNIRGTNRTRGSGNGNWWNMFGNNNGKFNNPFFGNMG